MAGSEGILEVFDDEVEKMVKIIISLTITIELALLSSSALENVGKISIFSRE